MSESTPPSPDAADWRLLSRGEQEHDEVSRCPAGHIHLDYGNLSVRFQPDEFLAFVQMLDEAAAHLVDRRPAPVQSIAFSRN